MLSIPVKDGIVWIEFVFVFIWLNKWSSVLHEEKKPVIFFSTATPCFRTGPILTARFLYSLTLFSWSFLKVHFLFLLYFYHHLTDFCNKMLLSSLFWSVWSWSHLSRSLIFSKMQNLQQQPSSPKTGRGWWSAGCGRTENSCSPFFLLQFHPQEKAFFLNVRFYYFVILCV